MNIKFQLRLVFTMQAVLLALAAWRNVHQLNPDAIAYCRIAGYYAAGQWELAVTGYWGPLLSWLLVPLLKAGCAPLVAARVVMALSGVVFLLGAVAVFRAFRLPRSALVAGAWVAMVWSVFWSVRHITPDLLMAGLVALALGATIKAMLTPCGHECVRRHTIAAGIWWGLAYLSKAVALPLAGLATMGLAWLALHERGKPRREVARRLGEMWLCLAVIAAPWVGVLSHHYGKFTFSTTGPIAHALAGPGEEARYHPAMVTLHRPEAGRVTQWEEPSRMAYRTWSPLESWASFSHQLDVMGNNAATIARWLGPVALGWLPGEANGPPQLRFIGFDLCGLALVGMGGAWIALVRRRSRATARMWTWALLPVVGLGGLYLPFWVQREEIRYFYPAFPFLWVLAVGTIGWLTRSARKARRRASRRICLSGAGLSFAIPALVWLGVALNGIPNPASRAAHELAVRVKSSESHGPLTGSGQLPGGRTGLYLAFLLRETWLGDAALATPADFAAVGAQRVVVRRGSVQAEAFARDQDWQALPEVGGGAAAVRLFHMKPMKSPAREK